MFGGHLHVQRCRAWGLVMILNLPAATGERRGLVSSSHRASVSFLSIPPRVPAFHNRPPPTHLLGLRACLTMTVLNAVAGFGLRVLPADRTHPSRPQTRQERGKEAEGAGTALTDAQRAEIASETIRGASLGCLAKALRGVQLLRGGLRSRACGPPQPPEIVATLPREGSVETIRPMRRSTATVTHRCDT